MEGLGEVGQVQVAQTEVVLHRSAKRTIAGKKKEIPGPPIPLRLVVSRVVGEEGKVLAEWYLLTNLKETEGSAEQIARWDAWRWRIESYHKLLKSAGQNAQEWLQESASAFFRRLLVASMACMSVWHLQKDQSEEAKRLRKILVRLSGRQMKHRVESRLPRC